MNDTAIATFLMYAGVDFKTKRVDLRNKAYKLQIWDTAGQERYNTIRKNFYRGAKVKLMGQGNVGGLR